MRFRLSRWTCSFCALSVASLTPIASVAEGEAAQAPQGEVQAGKPNPPLVPEARGNEEEEVLKSAIIEKTAAEAGPVQGPLHPALPPPEQPAALARSLMLYVSFRFNLNYDGDGGWKLTDGASRLGAIGLYQLTPKASALGRVELGFNAVDQFSSLITPDASAADSRDYTVFNPRLYYGGLEYDGAKLLAGKNWSAYYEVAGLTDRFVVGGGRAVGVYNAGTDGGGSGTGRADQVLQLHGRHLRWTYGLQAQARAQMPVFTEDRFDYGVGIGLMHKTTEGLSLGIAYNHAVPKDLTDAMTAQGFRGDDTSLAFGLQFRREEFTLAATYAVSRNHETDNEDVFFNASGGEIYARYDVGERVRVVAGLNRLKPDDADYAGAFELEQYIAGVQYAIGEPTFDRMIYLEYTYDDGRLADGEELANLATLGLRWYWAR